MIITRLIGGLGNQLFQYAYGLHLANKYQQDLKLDIDYYDTIQRGVTARSFSLHSLIDSLPIATKQDKQHLRLSNQMFPVLRKLHRFGIHFHPHYYLETQEFTVNYPEAVHRKGIYVDGFWQHIEYVQAVKSQLLEQVHADVPLAMQQYLSGANCFVAVHIRRGDYVMHPTHPVLTVGYYHQSLQLLKDQLPQNTCVLVFSDDIAWAKQNLEFNSVSLAARFVETGTDVEQFLLMKSCQHFIIANSTFSWWAACLGQQAHSQVFVPSFWISKPQFELKALYSPTWKVVT